MGASDSLESQVFQNISNLSKFWEKNLSDIKQNMIQGVSYLENVDTVLY